MDIVAPVKERLLTDYDFMFASGAKITVTLDSEAGDKLNEGNDRYVIDIVAKPSISDPEDFTDEEQLVIYKSGLAAVNICKRSQRMPNEEELFDMQKTLHALSSKVQ
jgi:hypothetical protein